MRTKIFTLFVLALSFIGSANAVNVTFQVDMNEVSDAFTTPEVNGVFNGWCGACAVMTDADQNGIWEITIDLEPGTYEYKFAADNWNIQEDLLEGSLCTITENGFTNRVITVESEAIVLDPVCWGSCQLCGAAQDTYDVTFRVDMSEVTEAYTTPEVNGTFNGWCGGCAPMTNIGGDVWEIVIPLSPGNYEFKFAADTWNIQESLTSGSLCTITVGAFTNRVLTVVDQDIDLGTVCWGSCNACGVAPEFYDVTFRVDMSESMEAFTTPEVNGTFNDWCGGCAPMTNIGNDVWELTIPLQPGNYEFKYAADAWNIQEELVAGSPCTISSDGFTNRTLAVVDSNIDLGTVCWAACEACDGSGLMECDLIDFSFDDASSLAGWMEVADATLDEASFDWSPEGLTTGALELSGTNTSDVAGRAYIFEYLDADFDYQGASNLVLSFDVKLAAPLVGTAFHMQTEFPGIGVTNNFDLQTQGINEAEWTNLSYEFNGVGDGTLFRIHFNMAAGAFSGAGGVILIDNIQLVCAGNIGIPGCTDPNALNFDPEAEENDGSCLYEVTFRVDMSQVTEAYTTPEVNGTFNDWCGGCAPMTNLGGDVWELVIQLQSGTYEFKYAADAWTIQEDLIGAGSCTVVIDGFTNRSLTVADANLDLGTVCWGSCEPCGALPETYNVTFRVDMSEVTEAYTTPEVNGTFNNWCGDCAPMTNIGNDVWELTIELEAGSHEFKYTADGFTIQEELSFGAPCTISSDGFTNRLLTVVDADIDLGTVCWGSCLACGVEPETYSVTFTVDMANVEEDFTTPEVNGTFNDWCGDCAPMTNIGDDLWQLTIELPAGSYEFKYSADNWTIQEELTEEDPCTVSNDGFSNRLLVVEDEDLALDLVCWSSCEACIVSVQEANNAGGFFLYPNPNRGDVVNITLPIGISSASQLRVYDAQGRLVVDQQVNSNEGLVQFSTAQLSSGTYQVLLLDASGVRSEKLMIKR